MTNKIINGIDVNECEFLECGMCNAQRNCDGYTGIECKYDNENCYYRQLKRLQQENEELKDENHYLREGLERQVCFTTNAEVYAEKCHETLEEIKAIANIDCKECVQIIDKINLFINENG